MHNALSAELLAIAWIRYRFMQARFALSIVQVIGGGVLVLACAALIGSA